MADGKEIDAEQRRSFIKALLLEHPGREAGLIQTYFDIC